MSAATPKPKKKGKGAGFPSMKGAELLAIFRRLPLHYAVHVKGGGGSHRVLKSDHGYPDVPFSWHDQDDLGPTAVKKMLKKTGLTEEECLDLL
ncbi:MAG: type II toxin-antitoxin system HicA family toxin [Candidatus Dormibacteria bacterium]